MREMCIRKRRFYGEVMPMTNNYHGGRDVYEKEVTWSRLENLMVVFSLVLDRLSN